MVPTLDHFAFRVTDLDISIEFYNKILGLKLLSRTKDESHHEAFAYLEFVGGKLELLQLLDDQNNPKAYINNNTKQPYCPHLAFKTENMDQLISSLQEQDVPVLEGPLEIPGMVKWIYITDPDNNIIEFVQWLK